MELLTKVNIQSSRKKIGYQDKILLLGSCFADNVGEKFGEHYFQTTVNPYGTLYNPASIANSLLSISSERLPIRYHNGLWHSMMHHGTFSHSDQNELLRRCEESQTIMDVALQDASTIIVTFGTAWVYEYQGQVVANCHKLPAKEFVRRRLTVEEIVSQWQSIIERMPNKHWIFTVSPIRHVKDGLHENQLSKAILLQAIDELLSRLRSSVYCLDYFPSYEIVLDELRDYRFYAEDMVHPSQVAVDYIWQRFVDTYMTADTKNEMRTLHQLWLDRQHRFLHPESEEAMKFEQRIAQKMQDLQQQYPWLR
jgi:hypothetical protein